MGSPNSSIVKPALLVATGRGVALAAMFAVPMFFARVLAPAEFGTYKQFFLIHATLYGIGLGLAEGLFYFLPLDAGTFACPDMVERFVAEMRRRPGISAMTCYVLALRQPQDRSRTLRHCAHARPPH